MGIICNKPEKSFKECTKKRRKLSNHLLSWLSIPQYMMLKSTYIPFIWCFIIIVKHMQMKFFVEFSLNKKYHNSNERNILLLWYMMLIMLLHIFILFWDWSCVCYFSWNYTFISFIFWVLLNELKSKFQFILMLSREKI